jgi:hypothetical protein
MPSVPTGEIFEHRRDHPAWSAPGSPEVNDDGDRGSRLSGERVRVGIDNPRKL